ncbi:M28 family peptidase [Arenibacter troitsensis]|uniref:Peptidase family M28 n=1 Tax=Arenibacter troitsensis TaxID=188872 RepID=A0A1X7KTE7_9FLAO|nr:M28 family peptidase [Arenibacter troitsensis]SMG44134.1 Peptidase family M28 [Arenibacter troitsensis]
MTKIPLFLFISLITLSWAQTKNSAVTTDDYLDILKDNLSGEQAYETTAFIEQFWRVVGNEGFNKSIHKVAESLKAAGYVLEENASNADRFTYRLEKRPLLHPTWEIVDASISLVGENTPLVSFSSNRNMVYINSISTPKNGTTAEVIYVEDIDELQRISVKGKIIFTETNATDIYKEGVLKKGALGIITYDNPDYLKPDVNVNSIQFRSLTFDPKNTWGIALSYNAKERLKAALAKGPVYAKVNISSKVYPSEELTLVANIKGSEIPVERLVFSAHVQEPGANDNASGVGVQLEMATVAAKLISNGSIDVQRTMTFIWGDEIISTKRYLQENEKRTKGIKWGLSLDMVGENTAITGGTFLIEKMPDPSAIWTRGKDKHTDWGGNPLTLKDMKPHYLNDYMIHNFLKQGKVAHWEVNTNPYEGGSDHTPFLDNNIPGLLFWHFTDQFYHTDGDRLDKVSQETLKNVGIASLASALTLINGDSYTAMDIVKIVRDAATNRLSEEFLLSEKSIKSGNPAEIEIAILKAWEDWYLKAIASTTDLASPDNTVILDKAILEAQAIIESQAKMFAAELEK